MGKELMTTTNHSQKEELSGSRIGFSKIIFVQQQELALRAMERRDRLQETQTRTAATTRRAEHSTGEWKLLLILARSLKSKNHLKFRRRVRILHPAKALIPAQNRDLVQARNQLLQVQISLDVPSSGIQAYKKETVAGATVGVRSVSLEKLELGSNVEFAETFVQLLDQRSQ